MSHLAIITDTNGQCEGKFNVVGLCVQLRLGIIMQSLKLGLFAKEIHWGCYVPHSTLKHQFVKRSTRIRVTLKAPASDVERKRQ